MDTIAAVKCNNCETIFDKLDVEATDPVYECSNCGTVFTRSNSQDGCSHKCPDCGKFSSKLEDHSCPECEQGINIKECELEAYQCPSCDVLFEEDDDTCLNCGATFNGDGDEIDPEGEDLKPGQ